MLANWNGIYEALDYLTFEAARLGQQGRPPRGCDSAGDLLQTIRAEFDSAIDGALQKMESGAFVSTFTRADGTMKGVPIDVARALLKLLELCGCCHLSAAQCVHEALAADPVRVVEREVLGRLAESKPHKFSRTRKRS